MVRARRSCTGQAGMRQVTRSGQEQGTIECGKLGDLLVPEADPLADIRNISKIHLVIKGGIANN
jgi:imidazolonepropionase-like amidohydrolase